MSFLFRESYVMAPFPEVMLRVRCGWQQFFKNVVSTVPNFRKQSFISIIIKHERNVLLNGFSVEYKCDIIAASGHFVPRSWNIMDPRPRWRVLSPDPLSQLDTPNYQILFFYKTPMFPYALAPLYTLLTTPLAGRHTDAMQPRESVYVDAWNIGVADGCNNFWPPEVVTARQQSLDNSQNSQTETHRNRDTVG